MMKKRLVFICYCADCRVQELPDQARVWWFNGWWGQIHSVLRSPRRLDFEQVMHYVKRWSRQGIMEEHGWGNLAKNWGNR